MASKKINVLNQAQIGQKLDRIAFQILEDNLDEKDLIMAGIVGHGYTLANRLKVRLEKISSIKATVMMITLNKDSTQLHAKTDIAIELATDKVVILVDDVLNSGRTLAFGLGVFLSIPLKKLRTVVLIDRSHRIFPVSTDFTGLKLATILKEHVEVVLDKKGQEDAIYLS
ncbi:MAG TPA: phosphoribosyltransferase family protein [Sphingobacteriaceae bacterium]|nr:phosphoribosyltransferase family protein [Sphingobacteriaceae bacterium]